MDALKQVALQTGDFETQERLGCTARRDPPPERRPVDAAVRRGGGRVRRPREGASGSARSPGSTSRWRSTGGSATSATNRCTSLSSAARIAPRRLRRGASRSVVGRSTSPASWGTASGPVGRRRCSARRWWSSARSARRRSCWSRVPRRPNGRTPASISCDAWGWGRGPRSGSASAAERSRSRTEPHPSSIGIRVRPPRAWVAGYDAYVGVARVRLAIGEHELAEELVSPIVVACRACGWSDGVVDGSLVLAEAALRRHTPAVAVLAADHALEEALRTGLPTVWRAHRAVAEAYRAAGDEKWATEHAAEAERGFAQVVEGSMIVRSAKRSCPHRTADRPRKGWSDDGDQPAPRGDPGPRPASVASVLREGPRSLVPRAPGRQRDDRHLARRALRGDTLGDAGRRHVRRSSSRRSRGRPMTAGSTSAGSGRPSRVRRRRSVEARRAGRAPACRGRRDGRRRARPGAR